MVAKVADAKEQQWSSDRLDPSLCEAFHSGMFRQKRMSIEYQVSISGMLALVYQTSDKMR